jgi:hypothetical protein
LSELGYHPGFAALLHPKEPQLSTPTLRNQLKFISEDRDQPAGRAGGDAFNAHSEVIFGGWPIWVMWQPAGEQPFYAELSHPPR